MEQIMLLFWENRDIKDKLDEQAIHAIETVLMVEYTKSIGIVKAIPIDLYLLK